MPLPAWLRRAARLAAATAGNWSNDRCTSVSASLAFYAAFSLAPQLVVAVAVGSIFFGEHAIEGRVYTELESLIGRDAALTIWLFLSAAAFLVGAELAAACGGRRPAPERPQAEAAWRSR